jgi:hypothetical protein
VWIDKAIGWSDEKKKEFIIKDNVGFGEWDWDVVANEWNPNELDDWGLDVWQDPPQDDDEDDSPKENEPKEFCEYCGK